MSSSDRKRVVVVGSSFAGMTADLELRKRVADRHEIVVLDPRPEFTFISSLIWLPFGGREPRDVTFPLGPVYSRKGIRFNNEAVAKIDPAAHAVSTESGDELRYDRLFRSNGSLDAIPGLPPSFRPRSAAAMRW
jgi:sulfide:quinone oxidoreductase